MSAVRFRLESLGKRGSENRRRHTSILPHQIHEELWFFLLDRDERANDGEGRGVPWSWELGERVKVLEVENAREKSCNDSCKNSNAHIRRCHLKIEGAEQSHDSHRTKWTMKQKKYVLRPAEL